MSTSYTGDPTSGLSPSPVPDPDSIPVVTLPADGDADNAASVAQALKQPNNEIAWLKKPRAKASSWVQRIRRYWNALLQPRFEVDHWGFPNGNVLQWDENWSKSLAGSISAFGSAQDLNWRNGTSTAVAIAVPGQQSLFNPSHPLCGTLRLSPDTGTTTENYVQRTSGTCVPDLALCFSLEFHVAMDSKARTNFRLGIINAGGTPAAFTFGAVFEALEGDTNWFVKVDGVTRVDTGVAVDGAGSQAYHRLKIVYMGATVSDDATARTLFFIDDAASPVANIAHAIFPFSTDPLTPTFGAQTQTTGGAAIHLAIAQVRYRQNLYAAA